MPPRLYARLLAAGFAAVLALGMAGLCRGGGMAAGENRRLSPAPGWPTDWPGWTRRVDAWVSDRFGLRGPLIRLHAQLAFALRTREARRPVLQGRDGWLFYADRFSRLSYQRLNPLTPGEAARWHAALQARRAAAAEFGAAYLFTAVPDKHTLYPELMPDSLPVADTRSRLQAVREVGAAALGPAYLDLEPVLRQAKGGLPLYYRTDTHWTAYGAYLGYRAILSRLRAVGPAPEPVVVEGFHLQAYADGDLARMLAVHLEETTAEAPAELCAACPTRRLRLLLLHDSFGVALMPYLRASFAETIFVPGRRTHDEIRALLAQHRPDVVIEERVERFLNYGPEEDDARPASP